MPSVAIIGTRGYPSYYGGFETAVRKISPFLADHGWDVTVYGRADNVDLTDPARDFRIRSILTRGIQTKSMSTLTFGLSASIHAITSKPDVILVMNVANGFFLPFLKLRGIPTLVNVDGMEWDREKWGKTAKAVFRLGALLTARYSSEIIVDSREIGRRWLKDFHREGHFIPYGGIRYAEPLELEPGLKHRGYVLLVARFVPENTVPLFFEVAPTLATKYPVVIVGSSGFDGQLDEIAKQLATIYPDIHYFGHIHDDQRLLSLWQHAGVYFHGHSVGGTNPTLVQAMALGSPIVARNTPYNREVLGEKGAFFSPSRESILSAIETLMADPEAQAQQERTNIARARALYDWEDVAAKYEELFRSSIK